jgi:hypothetical protein
MFDFSTKEMAQIGCKEAQNSKKPTILPIQVCIIDVLCSLHGFSK